MATWEELVRMTQTRNPGMTRTPRGATMGGVTRGADLDNLSRGDAVAGSTGGAFSAGISTPVMSSGQSSVPTQSLAPRLAQGLGTMTSGVQNSRTSAEASANPRIERQMRRDMANRNWATTRLQGPGTLNPVEARFLMAQQQQGQAAVDSSLAAINDMRVGAIAERGQNLNALAALEDRQMREAGAFDRELLGLNERMLAGQFGLAGIEAEGQARDPYAAATLELTRQYLGDSPSVDQLAGAMNLLRGSGTAPGSGGPGATVETNDGLTFQLENEAATTRWLMSMDPATRAAVANVMDVPLDDNGVPITSEQAAEQAAERAERERERELRAEAQSEAVRLERARRIRELTGGAAAPESPGLVDRRPSDPNRYFTPSN